MNTDNDRIKIIQLTDCHLLSNPDERLNGWNTTAMLQKTMQYISENEKNVDLYLLTGDLSQDGSTMSYQRLSQMCSKIDAPIHALPGNHDDFSSMQSFFKHTITCNKRVDLGQWQILLLDTTEAGKTSGRLSKTELEWLQEQLQQHADRFTLIAMHHYPLTINSQWLDNLGLKNADEFLQLIQSFTKIKAIVCGHIHQEQNNSYNNIAVISTPSSCYQFKPNSEQFALDTLSPGYRWLELEQNGHINTGVTRINA